MVPDVGRDDHGQAFVEPLVAGVGLELVGHLGGRLGLALGDPGVDVVFEQRRHVPEVAPPTGGNEDDGRVSEYVLPRVPASAGALLHDDGGRILVLKPTYKRGWTVPGGQMEEDGESPWEACRREVAEETGLTCGGAPGLRRLPAPPSRASGRGALPVRLRGGARPRTGTGWCSRRPRSRTTGGWLPTRPGRLFSGPVGRRVAPAMSASGTRLPGGRATGGRRGRGVSVRRLPEP